MLERYTAQIGNTKVVVKAAKFGWDVTRTVKGQAPETYQDTGSALTVLARALA